MREIETDYLVIGAGATGIAFVDALVNRADVDVVMVDRRSRPGGHWLDAYPFVRLHQPSATYGVDSRELGNGRIDTSGPNAGYYELATGAEVVRYFGEVFDEGLLPTGRVRFFGTSDYKGNDNGVHHFVSLDTGEATSVRVRKRFVDATYVAPSIPSRHVPSFEIAEGVRFVSPNRLAELSERGARYTIIGSGKTAMDTCGWLIEQGVAPDDIRWIKPREPLMFNRAFTQPRELVASYMQLQASVVRAAAVSEEPMELALRLRSDGVFTQIHTDIEPSAFRGGTISLGEVERIRQIENVVRSGYVRAIGADRVTLTGGGIDAVPGEVFVDCTARGVPTTNPVPIFAPDRLTLQFVTLGNATYSAATIGVVEALAAADADLNALCPPSAFDGTLLGLPATVSGVLRGSAARTAVPEINAWNMSSRMNPTRGAGDRKDDPVIASAFATIGEHMPTAIANIVRLAANGHSSSSTRA
jgi:hypothetical protein